MIKNYKTFIYLYIFLFSKTILASSSASFLISQTAFNNYDFTQVLYEYSANQNQDSKNDYLDELISAVVTQNVILAEKISKKILLKDPNNQEARLLSMVKAFNSKNKKELQILRFDKNNNKNELFEFIFFLNDKIKSKTDISNSFLEIVRTSYSKQNTNYAQNYNFLLFYTSLSILINKENYEATFIKGQLLQMIDDYYFAEITYLKIPENGDPYLEGHKCSSCGAIFLGERTVCSNCTARDAMEPITLSNKGKLYSYSITFRSFPGIDVPYISAIVDLDGGGTIKGNLINRIFVFATKF